MKIDRRSFLALGLGAAAGTAFTPLPWKLTDDASIWTQNWRWLPLPEDGDVTYETTACTLCPGGCGIRVRKVKDRIVKIEGLPEHPVNQGGICALGISGTQILYGGSRVTSPMRRSGDRGKNEWTRITWDEALAEVKAQINALVDADKADTIACITGSDRGTVPLLFKRLLAVLGSPNFMTTATMEDSYRAVFRKMHGLKGPVDVRFDFENTGFVLSFGSGLIEGWGSPLRMIRAANVWKANKTPMIQVEQRLSNTAAFSGGLLAVNPGTEADLALGLCHAIISGNLHQAGSVSGFAEFANLLKQKYSVDTVATKTGLKATAIVDLARKFANPASRSVAVCGRGKGTTAGSMREFMAVHALNILAGRVNAPGGVFAVPAPDDIAWAGDTVMTSAISGKTRIDEAGTGAYTLADSLLNRIPSGIVEKGESSIGLLFVSEANPVYTLSGTKNVRKAFKKIPYIVSFATCLDDTTAYADLILPNHSYLERYQDVPVRAGLSKPLVNLTKPVSAPVYDTQNVGDTVISIAKSLEGSVAEAFPWENYEDCLAKTLGGRWETLKEKGFVEGEANPVALGNVILPSEMPDIPAISGDGNLPLILLPKDSMRLWGDAVADPPFALKIVPDTELKGTETVVEVSPKTAVAQGLEDGKEAVLTTTLKSVTVKVAVSDGIMDGVVAIPRGLGRSSAEKYLDDKGVNVCELMEPQEDKVSGFDAVIGTRASLKRA